jgi:hypothetical protein
MVPTFFIGATLGLRGGADLSESRRDFPPQWG